MSRAAMSNRRYRTVQTAFARYFLRLADDGKFLADCIDAGALGVGDTPEEALMDLIKGLEALYQSAKKQHRKMNVKAREEDERLFGQAVAGAKLDKSMLAYGVMRRLAVGGATGTRSKAGRRVKPKATRFSIYKHIPLGTAA